MREQPDSTPEPTSELFEQFADAVLIADPLIAQAHAQNHGSVVGTGRIVYRTTSPVLRTGVPGCSSHKSKEDYLHWYRREQA